MSSRTSSRARIGIRISLARRIAPVGVRLVDERLTTVSAARQLREAGKSSRQQRSRIDAAAAVAILEHALDSERHRGFPPGELVSAEASTD